MPHFPGPNGLNSVEEIPRGIIYIYRERERKRVYRERERV
jgi:hypothetical protein